MRYPLYLSAAMLCFALSASVCTWAQQPPRAARPGTINYVEGEASVDSQPVSQTAVGSLEMQKGQSLVTHAGKVEILLTPGVFLRVADNSSLKMTSPELANTGVAIEKGRASVEVLDIHKENNIRVTVDDASAKLLNRGLYEFDAEHNQIRVFKGKTDIFVGDQKITVADERQLTLNTGEKLKSQYFDTRQFEDDFLRWCALRSGYLSEASVDSARIYVGIGPGWYGPGWIGPGWYWNPWFTVFTFLPADGVFYSPFGWAFYSPIIVYRSPFFFYGYYGHQPHRFDEFHYPYGHGFEGPGGFHGGGFHAGRSREGGGRR